MNKYLAAFISVLAFETTCPAQSVPALPDYPGSTGNSATTENVPAISDLSDLSNIPRQQYIPFIGQPKGVWPPRFQSSPQESIALNASTESTAISRASAAPALPDLASAVPVVPTVPDQPAAPVAQVAPTAPVAPADPVVPSVPATPGLPDLTSAAPATPEQPATPVAPVAPVAQVAPPVPEQPAAPVVTPTAAPQIPAPVAAQTATPAAPVASQLIPAAPAPQPSPAVVPLAVDINSAICPLKIRQAHQGEHPMGPLLEWAVASRKIYLSKIQDYTCTMVKKERQGKTIEPNRIFMKVKEQPFSVYMRFEEPKARAGQEAMYVQGQNNNKLLGHDVGIKKYLGSLWLVPDGTIAMMGQRYPITDSGIANLVTKMIETMQSDMKYGECSVQFTFDGPQIEGRPCIRIDVVHPKKRDCFKFHKAEIFLDKELGIPLRYAAYLWPDKPGEAPVLDEEYSFSNLKFNVGLTAKDFDRDNKEYQF